MTKKALGKGLRAFIPENYTILKEERYAEVDIDQIKPNPVIHREVIYFNNPSVLAA